jgi:hypothetical protein
VGEGGLCERRKRPCNSIVCCRNSVRLCRVSACYCVELIAGGGGVGVRTVICSRASTSSALSGRRPVAQKPLQILLVDRVSVRARV